MTRAAEVLAFIVLRKGFIRPDKEYLTDIIRYFSPDVFDSKDVAIHAHALPPTGAQEMAALMWAMLAKVRRDYSEMSVEQEVLEARDKFGQSVVLGKLFIPIRKPNLRPPVKAQGRQAGMLQSLLDWSKRRFYRSSSGIEPIFGPTASTSPFKEPWSGGVLFWFDWTMISESRPNYGRYVYQNLLPLCIDINVGSRTTRGLYFFYDGDVLAKGDLRIPFSSPSEKHCLERIADLGHDSCYVVAILASGTLDWPNVERQLRNSSVVGFLGQSLIPGVEFDDFESLMDEMALPYSFELRGRNIRLPNSAPLHESELEAMGFTVVSKND